MSPPDRAATQPPARPGDKTAKPRRVRRKPPVPTDTPVYAETVRATGTDPATLLREIEQLVSDIRAEETTTLSEG
jgi:hypothetical protein